LPWRLYGPKGEQSEIKVDNMAFDVKMIAEINLAVQILLTIGAVYMVKKIVRQAQQNLTFQKTNKLEYCLEP
jgi:hypothetical protein